MSQIGPSVRGLLATPSGNPELAPPPVILSTAPTPEVLACAAPQCASLAARGP